MYSSVERATAAAWNAAAQFKAYQIPSWLDNDVHVNEVMMEAVESELFGEPAKWDNNGVCGHVRLIAVDGRGVFFVDDEYNNGARYSSQAARQLAHRLIELADELEARE